MKHPVHGAASMIPTVVINTTPLKSAYTEENHFPATVLISTTGPIPLNIIEASDQFVLDFK